jgi:hypothetical protein
MATPTGIAAAARQAASGYALRALPRQKTYTTSWDINILCLQWSSATAAAPASADSFAAHSRPPRTSGCYAAQT